MNDQEQAFRQWWDERRADELDAVGGHYAERVAFRAGWLAASASAPQTLTMDESNRLTGVGCENR